MHYYHVQLDVRKGKRCVKADLTMTVKGNKIIDEVCIKQNTIRQGGFLTLFAALHSEGSAATQARCGNFSVPCEEQLDWPARGNGLRQRRRQLVGE